MSGSDNRHASNLELFLDLVFVFSVTQVTSYVSDHLSVGGVARGALLGFLVWWQWTAFTWAGTAIDFQTDARARLVVLAMVPAMLVMAISVPLALDSQGLWFAVAYFVVQLFVLGLQGLDVWPIPEHRTSWLRYAPLAIIAPGLLVAGGLVHGNARLALWLAVAALMIGSALLANDPNAQWRIDATHFAERHALFIIITLGEVLVAIGATAASANAAEGLDLADVAAVAGTAGVACVLWWAYFGFVPAVIELMLDRAEGAEQARLARDVGSFGHFPLVFGLILYAVVARHVVAKPDGLLAVSDRWLVFAAIGGFIGGQLVIQYRMVRRLSPERLVVIAAVGGLALSAAILPGTAVVVCLGGGLGVMSFITWRRFRGTELGRALQGP